MTGEVVRDHRLAQIETGADLALSRRDLLRGMGLGAAAFALPGCVASDRELFASDSPDNKTNFVFIYIDDMGWKDLGFMGSRYYETPHIDRLARDGVVFTNAYANAPNCAPSRACLMSGQYTPRHGVYTVGTPERGKARLRKLIPTPNKTTLDTDIVTIPEALRSAGYTSACIGKWHLGTEAPYRPEDQGFDVVVGRARRSHFTDDREYLTDVLTDEAVKFIGANRAGPFFLYLSHFAVHTPIQAKPEIIEKYKAKAPADGHNNPAYAAMIESVDQSVGRVLGKLDESGIAENTVVFFFSDNGGYANATSVEPLRGSKGMLYEGGIRVPLIVCWPGKVTAGRSCDVPVIGVDFYPTILEMAGVAKPAGQTLDGESIVPLLMGKGRLSRKAIYWHFPAYLEPYNERQRPWRATPASAIRQGDWKLIEFFEDGRLELYNVADDISETDNLAAKMPDKTGELHGALINWRKSVGAPVPTERNPKFVGK
ncbi:MAG: sulfatase-like hydrolase/transferase [Phycisphaerales bacterium]|nr:MAG: sulfatase-like hydrolase/transferase [Phycisphaerales bacterium]